MTPDADPESSELAVSEADEVDGVIVAALDVHQTTPEGVRGVDQLVGRQALAALPEALECILQVMRKPGRGAQSQLAAALKVVELAERYQGIAVADGDGRVYVLDRGQAARVLAKRLGLQE